ncbi:MAG: deoxyribose-phosphate aldolase [Gammaproteobacteria bacterium]|nr:deoxyribose-phosphate aldolase [Gammaproteobacteria bacterium]
MRFIPFIDLTSLSNNDDVDSTEALCKKAVTPKGDVAAVCVYPQFVATARQCLEDTGVKVATVANFPSGRMSVKQTVQQISTAVNDGADEIDVVMPYSHFMQGDKSYVFDFLDHCRKSCLNKTLKVILETSELIHYDNIFDAASIAIESGADFIKTSTGKSKSGITLEAVEAMLAAIQVKQISDNPTRSSVGLKISGGIRTIRDVDIYFTLVAHTMGPEWLTPTNFRIGASKLLDAILT